MKKIYLLLILCLAFAGCKSDPYEGTPKLKAFGVPTPTPTPTPKPIAFSLSVADVMNFKEGEVGDFFIKAEVPDPGVPQLSFVDVPVGMNFDSATSKLVWTPALDAANDPANPVQKFKIYTLKIRLMSSIDNISVFIKEVVIVVKDSTLTRTSSNFSPIKTTVFEADKTRQLKCNTSEETSDLCNGLNAENIFYIPNSNSQRRSL